MSSNVPIIRQFSWASLIPQLLIISVLSLISYAFGLNEFLSFHGISANIMWGAVGQLVLWFILRHLFAKNHNKGVYLVKQEKYSEAIPFFKDSYEIFSKYSWADKYRYYLISTSKMSYKEMALNNIAFCFGQIGDKENAIQFYKRTLKEYPDSGIAKAALNFIETLSVDK